MSAPATSAPAAADSAAVTADAAARTHQADALASSLQETYDDLASRLRRVEAVTGKISAEWTIGLQSELTKSFAEIGDHLHSLGLSFLTGSEKRQHHAAIRINSATRGYLARRAWRRARAALHAWRHRELMGAHHTMTHWMRRHADLGRSAEAIRASRDASFLRRIIDGWRGLAQSGRPARRLLDVNLSSLRHYRSSLQRRTFVMWRRVTHQTRAGAIRWVDRDGRRVALRADIVTADAGNWIRFLSMQS